MALNQDTIQASALDKITTASSMKQVAAKAGSDPTATEKEVTEAVASIVTEMLNNQWTVVEWLISEDWVATLVSRVVDAVGQTLLKHVL